MSKPEKPDDTKSQAEPGKLEDSADSPNIPALPKEIQTTNTKKDIAHRFKPIPPESFPDTAEGPKLKPLVLATIPNTEHMLNRYGITVQYCVITKQTIITIPEFQGTSTNIANSALTQIQSLAKLNRISSNSIPSYISAIADRNQKNIVLDWIVSEPWDGKDRLPEFYDTLITQQDFPEEMRNILIFRWLISAVAAAWLPSGFRCRGVLTLQGPQSIGKTSWVLSLVTDEALRERAVLIDHLLDAGNKDSMLQAIGHWIAELGELDSTFRRDMARIKGFLTSPTDKIRAPYERAPANFPRKTVFCATVNDAQFLVDATGNTRFWTIPLRYVNWKHGINMQQLWAQVLHIYTTDDAQWWLTPEEEVQLEKLNRKHRAISAIRDRIESSLNVNAPANKWTLKTPSELLRCLDINNPTNTQAKECAQILRELFGESKRSQGANKWSVPPIGDPDDEY